jgi:TolB-like protein
MRFPVLWGLLCISFLLVFATRAEASSVTESKRKRTPVIAVLPFRDVGAVAQKEGYGQAVTSMVSTHLRNETSFMVVERSQLTGIIDEKKLEMLELTEENRSRLARLHRVEVLLMGDVSVLDGVIQLDCRLISVQSGEVVVAQFDEVRSVKDLRGRMSALVKDIELKYLRQWMGDLSVVSTPVDADVYLDGAFVGTASPRKAYDRSNMLEGKYYLTLVAGGYQTWADTIAIIPRSRRQVQANLKSLPGRLKILSEPSGARVLMNNKEVGYTPLELESVEQGRYDLALEMENHRSYQEVIQVESGQLMERLAKLEIIPGEIYVTSEPRGMLVFYEDQLVGVTPLHLNNIQPGSNRSIVLRHDLFQEYREMIVVKPSETRSIKAEMKRKTGVISFAGTQDSITAVVSQNNQALWQKTLPVHRQELEMGEYTVEFMRPRHFSRRVSVDLKANEEYRETITLREKPGVLLLAGTIPKGADLYINGTYYGKARGAMPELPKGNHHITVKAWDDEFNQDVYLEADEQKQVVVKLGAQSRATLWSGVIASLMIAILMVGK